MFCSVLLFLFFFKQKTAYEMRISDWSSDVCSSDLRFGQACVLAAELPGAVEQIYAHFLHTPASVARYTALMTGLPWSAPAHAQDIWTIPDWVKREKRAEVRWRSEERRVGKECGSTCGSRCAPYT